jgi:hypothetical protein
MLFETPRVRQTWYVFCDSLNDSQLPNQLAWSWVRYVAWRGVDRNLTAVCERV